MRSYYKILPCLLFLALHAKAQEGAFTDFLFGHYGLYFDYIPEAGNADDGWNISLAFDEDNDFNDNEGITHLDPASMRLLASPATEQSIASSVSHLGPVDEPLWLLPQSNDPGKLFLGFRTIFNPGIFQTSTGGRFSPSALGNIAIAITDVKGTGIDLGGHFAMWESRSLGNLEFHFDTSDGITDADRLEPVPAGAHSHYNWGMTKPGSYEVTFRASGRLNPWQPNGGQDTSGEATFTFVVPFSGYRAGEVDCRLNDSVELPAALFHNDENGEYASNRIALVTENQTHQSTPAPYGYIVNFAGNAAAPESRIGIAGTNPLSLPQNTSLADPPFQLLAVQGPGTLAITPLTSSSAGFSFSEKGIYRVTLMGLLQENGSAQVIQGAPFQLVFLAGLTVDYDYADWADSYERLHSIPEGTLSDPFSDSDSDGIPNGIEYQLFWHGFDPNRKDAGKMPIPSFMGNQTVFEFLRDTYKDDFNQSALRLAVSYSQDLETWTDWHVHTDLKPNGVFETSAEPEQAVGRIMARYLRAENDPQKVFFRFNLF